MRQSKIQQVNTLPVCCSSTYGTSNHGKLNQITSLFWKCLTDCVKYGIMGIVK